MGKIHPKSNGGWRLGGSEGRRDGEVLSGKEEDEDNENITLELQNVRVISWGSVCSSSFDVYSKGFISRLHLLA